MELIKPNVAKYTEYRGGNKTTPSTLRQRLVVGIILEEPRTSIYQAMRKAGYAHNTAIAPTKNLLGKQTFQDIAKEAGLTELFLVDALVADIKAKPEKRHKEIELGFKVLGTLQPKDPAAAGDTYNNILLQNNNFADSQEAKDLADQTTKILMDITKRKVVPNDPQPKTV